MSLGVSPVKARAEALVQVIPHFCMRGSRPHTVVASVFMLRRLRRLGHASVFPEFACCTSTKVQILTLDELCAAGSGCVSKSGVSKCTCVLVKQ
jgi:hypothetical protein